MWDHSGYPDDLTTIYVSEDLITWEVFYSEVSDGWVYSTIAQVGNKVYVWASERIILFEDMVYVDKYTPPDPGVTGESLTWTTMAVDSTGKLHMFGYWRYYQRTPLIREYKLAYVTLENGVWSSPSIFEDPITGDTYVSTGNFGIVIDSNDVPHGIYVTNSRLCYINLNTMSAELIAENIWAYLSIQISVDIGPDDTIYIGVASEEDQGASDYYYAHLFYGTSGSWSNQSYEFSTANQEMVQFCTVGVDRLGGVHFTWDNTYGYPFYLDSRYVYKPANGDFQEPIITTALRYGSSFGFFEDFTVLLKNFQGGTGIGIYASTPGFPTLGGPMFYKALAAPSYGPMTFDEYAVVDSERDWGELSYFGGTNQLWEHGGKYYIAWSNWLEDCIYVSEDLLNWEVFYTGPDQWLVYTTVAVSGSRVYVWFDDSIVLFEDMLEVGKYATPVGYEFRFMAADSAGKLHLVGNNDISDALCYVTFENGIWSEITEPGPTNASSSVGYGIVIDSSDIPHCFYIESSSLYYMNLNTLESELVSDGDMWASFDCSISVAIGPDDVLYVAVQTQDYPYTPGSHVYHANLFYGTPGSWSRYQHTEYQTESRMVQNTIVGVDPSGGVHFTWDNTFYYPASSEFLYTYKPPGGSFSEPLIKTHSGAGASFGFFSGKAVMMKTADTLEKSIGIYSLTTTENLQWIRARNFKGKYQRPSYGPLLGTEELVYISDTTESSYVQGAIGEINAPRLCWEYNGSFYVAWSYWDYDIDLGRVDIYTSDDLVNWSLFHRFELSWEYTDVAASASGDKVYIFVSNSIALFENMVYIDTYTMPAPPEGYITEPILRLDSTGRLHILAKRIVYTAGPPRTWRSDMAYTTFENGSFAPWTIMDIYASPYTAFSDAYTMVIDKDGKPQIFFVEDLDLQSVDIDTLEVTTIAYDFWDGLGIPLSSAIDSHGTIYVAGSTESAYESGYWARVYSNAGGSWSYEQFLDERAQFGVVAVDPDDGVHLTWDNTIDWPGSGPFRYTYKPYGGSFSDVLSFDTEWGMYASFGFYQGRTVLVKTWLNDNALVAFATDPVESTAWTPKNRACFSKNGDTWRRVRK